MTGCAFPGVYVRDYFLAGQPEETLEVTALGY